MTETQLTVDTSAWPLVVLTYAGQPRPEEVRDHLREIEDEVLARERPFVQVVDLSRAVRPQAQQRLLIAEHQNDNEERYERFCLGEAYVVPSAELKGAMTGVFFAARPPYPYTFVGTVDEAREWARERLASGAGAGAGSPPAR
jgi:hypothetical protein